MGFTPGLPVNGLPGSLGFKLISMSQPEKYWYAGEDGSVIQVRAYPTQIRNIFLVEDAYPAILGEDLFAWEDVAINAALGKLQQKQQDIIIRVNKNAERLREIRSGKAKGSEVREGPDSSQ